MRNLKKILAMVLALVMSLSLMATAGAAEATAAAANDYTTAKAVVEGLDIFRGDEGGMRYDSTITRAETAALIYRIATGDVADAKVALNTNHPFKDIGVYEQWATGYVSYGYNAQIIKGNGDGTFAPNDPVTGYATLAMILRTLGYGKNGEFEGDSWEITTASRAYEVGLLDGVTPSDQTTLGQPATRGLVAQILFNSLLKNTVIFNIITPNNYSSTDETLGYKWFGLETIEGVVMANEWANLNEDDNGGGSVLKAGTTQLKLEDGSTRTLSAVVSEDPDEALDAVGMTYVAYIANGEGSAKKALTLAEGANTVAFNEGKSVNTGALDEGFESLEALARTESVRLGSDTEYYVDYAQSWNEDCKSDYLIRYAIAKAYIDGGYLYKDDTGPVLAASSQEWRDQIAAWVDDGTVTPREIKVNVGGTDKVVECYLRTIRIGKDITKIDQDIMFEIFDNADRTGDNTTTTTSELRDYALGEVYVGTTSMKDYSDEMSWKSFKAEYFIDTKNSRTFETAQNGESVRIIDNNGDGTAEYVLKIQYNLDQALDTYKDTLLYNALNLNSNSIDEVYYATEISVGDVVLWNVIDGKASIWLAETDTDKIDTKNFRNITVTTDGGATYGQSGINNRTGMDQLIMNMDAGTEYIMYKDRFGFVRAYALAAGTNYALLTEMYPTSGQNFNYVNTNNAIAEVKVGDEKVTEYTVADGTKNVFFNGNAWTSRSQYFNTDYNYLQPAIAHLGNPNNTPGYFKGQTSVGGAAPTFDYSDWGRRVAVMLDADGNNDKNPLNPAGDFGVFDYGKVEYAASSDTNATGPIAISGAAGEAKHSFSFTNVATYTLNDDVVSLSSASKLAITQDGEQIYYTVGNIGVDGTKTWLSKWIAAQKAAGSTQSDADLAVDFQDLVDGTNKGGDNAGLTIGLYPVYAVDYVQLDPQDVASGTRHFSINANYTANYNASSNGYVDATVNTEFYIVMAGNILYAVGYDALPNIKAENVRATYAVAKNTTKAEDGRDYWVADVIVFEVDGLTNAYQSISLMYYNPWETVTSGIRYVQSLNNEWTALQPDYEDQAKMNIVPADVNNSNANVNWGNHSWRGTDYGFYALYDTELETEGTLDAGSVTKITSDWNDHGIYAGTVQRIKGILNSSGYIDVDLKGRDYSAGTPISDEWITHLTVRNIPIYRVSTTDAGTMVISETNDINEVKLGDEIIWVYNVAETRISFIVDLGRRTNAVDGFNYTAAGWLTDIYDGTYTNTVDSIKTSIIGEQTNTTITPNYDWTVTLNKVNSGDNDKIIETKTYGAVEGGTVMIPADEVNLTGWTLSNVQNVTGATPVAVNASTVNGNSYYVIQNIHSNLTLQANLTVTTLTVALTSVNGTIALDVNDRAVSPAPTTGDTTNVVVNDTFKYTVTGLNRTQYSYTLTTVPADAATLTWTNNTTAVISGTMGGTNVALTLTQGPKATNTISIGNRDGATVQITSTDNTGAAVSSNTGATVLADQDVTFTVTAPTDSEVTAVTYTVLGETPVTMTADENGVYTILGSVVERGLPIEINVTVASTAPIEVTLTTTDCGRDLFVSTDGTTWKAAGATTTIQPGDDLYIRASDDVAVTRTSGSGTVAADPAGSYTTYKVTGITSTTTLTIEDVYTITVTQGTLTGNTVTAAIGSATQAPLATEYKVAKSATLNFAGTASITVTSTDGTTPTTIGAAGTTVAVSGFSADCTLNVANT